MLERKKFVGSEKVLAEKRKNEIAARATTVIAIGGIGWIMSTVLGKEDGDNEKDLISKIFLLILGFLLLQLVGWLIYYIGIKKTEKNIKIIKSETDALNKKAALFVNNTKKCEAQSSIISGLLTDLSKFKGANYKDIETEDRYKLTQLVNDLRTLMAFLGEEL